MCPVTVPCTNNIWSIWLSITLHITSKQKKIDRNQEKKIIFGNISNEKVRKRGLIPAKYYFTFVCLSFHTFHILLHLLPKENQKCNQSLFLCLLLQKTCSIRFPGKYFCSTIKDILLFVYKKYNASMYLLGERVLLLAEQNKIRKKTYQESIKTLDAHHLIEWMMFDDLDSTWKW